MFCIFSSQSTGIEISDSFLRLITVSKKGKVIALKGYSEISLAPEIIVDGEIRNTQKFSESITKLIKNIQGDKRIKGEIITSPPEKQIFTILINNNGKQDISKNTKTKETPEIILNNIKNYIPLPIDDIYLDWQQINEEKILITASPKKIIDNYISSFKNTNFHLTAIDVKTASILRSIISNREANRESKLIVNIGELYSTIILGNNDIIEFTMNIPFTEKIVNELISNKLNLSKAQTKKAKKVCGIDQKKCHGAIKKILGDNLEELIENIKKVISFHKENTKNYKPITEIILCGQGIKINGIGKFLAEKLNIKIKIGDPLVNIDKTNNLLTPKDSMAFATTIGMALRGLI